MNTQGVVDSILTAPNILKRIIINAFYYVRIQPTFVLFI